eukprot:g10391.t1
MEGRAHSPAPEMRKRAPGVPRSQKKWLKRAREGEQRAKRKRAKRSGAAAATASAGTTAVVDAAAPAPSCGPPARRSPDPVSSKEHEQTKTTGQTQTQTQRPPKLKLRIVINCSFCERMSLKEVISLRKQIELSAAALRKNQTPTTLHLTSFDPDTNWFAAAWVAVRDHFASSSDGGADEMKSSALEHKLHQILFTTRTSEGIFRSLALEKWGVKLHKEGYWEVEDWDNPSLPSSPSTFPAQEAVKSREKADIVVLSPDAEEPLLRLLTEHRRVQSCENSRQAQAASSVNTLKETETATEQEQLQEQGNKQAAGVVLAADVESPAVEVRQQLAARDARELLDEQHTAPIFVLGGLVDRTVRKNQTLDQAKEVGLGMTLNGNGKNTENNTRLSCRRLPIKEFAPKGCGKILNIDTVVKMLLLKAGMETGEGDGDGDQWSAVFDQTLSSRFLLKK